MGKTILINIISLINWLCNIIFILLIITIWIWYFSYSIELNEIKNEIWHILILCIMWIIFIPNEGKLEKMMK